MEGQGGPVRGQGGPARGQGCLTGAVHVVKKVKNYFFLKRLKIMFSEKIIFHLCDEVPARVGILKIFVTKVKKLFFSENMIFGRFRKK